ncbi:BON domain-containing protein [Leucothrix pacifica]|uniref:BON domain-containing protein n=1 Tax=Leucothrix pacifica TaxID=1247513 RepID=A0A317CVL5_9GAMM|nr:BON domain-containing protein [Leucothrix pacifica]PWR00393.1 hypothetical protein DKW60_02245 [Leucothrix pacifica]
MIKDLCRIGSDMSKKRWKLWAIPGFLGLLALTMLTRCNPIENDLQQRSQSILNDQGMSWAKTELDGRGRDLLLTGVAPSEDAKNQAINLTQGVYGVRTVDHDITVKEYVSSVFKINHSTDKVTLSGSLPDQASIDLAVNKAQSLYGEANVVNELSINEMAKKPAWLAGAASLMAALYGAENLAMDATDSHVNISGTVGSEEAKAQLVQQAKASFGDQFSESIKVVQVGPTAEELAAIEAARVAEEQRLAAEAEAARIAEEKRLAAEAEAARIAEEKRLAAEAEAARIAEEKRLAAEAEAARIAEEKRLAAEAEAARIAEEKRLAAEAEAARIAEEKRLAAEAEAARIAEEKRIAAEAEAARIAEEKRIAAEAEAARLAEEKRIAEAAEAARLAKEAEEARIAQAKRLAEHNRQMLVYCQLKLNELINTNPPVFANDSGMILGSGYGVLGIITLHVNSCSDLLHRNHQYIDVVSQAGKDETSPQSPAMGYARAKAIISYLENINGIHPGLLRPRENTATDSIGESQLHFTITE